MTTDEIVRLAEDNKISFTVCYDKHGYSYNGVECREEDFLKFAREIFEKGQQEEIRRQKTGIGYVNGMLVVNEF